MASLCLRFVICVLVSAGYSSTQDDFIQLKQFYLGLIMECTKEHPIGEGVLTQLQHHEIPDDENTKCLFACVYKRAGMMDDQGYMSVQGVDELTKKYVSDPNLMHKAMQFNAACQGVNNAQVSDGVRGCDRAALLFKCSIEKASLFNLGI